MFLQMLIRKGNTGFYKINKTIKGINVDELIYHKTGCTHADYDNCETCYSKRACAEKGAFACPYCCPNTGAKIY